MDDDEHWTGNVNCEPCQDAFGPARRGELGAADRAAFEAHLAACPGCRAAWGTETRLHAAWATEGASLAPSRALQAALLAVPTRERRLRALVPLTLPLAMLCCFGGSLAIWFAVPGAPPGTIAGATPADGAAAAPTGVAGGGGTRQPPRANPAASLAPGVVDRPLPGPAGAPRPDPRLAPPPVLPYATQVAVAPVDTSAHGRRDRGRVPWPSVTTPGNPSGFAGTATQGPASPTPEWDPSATTTAVSPGGSRPPFLTPSTSPVPPTQTLVPLVPPTDTPTSRPTRPPATPTPAAPTRTAAPGATLTSPSTPGPPAPTSGPSATPESVPSATPARSIPPTAPPPTSTATATPAPSATSLPTSTVTATPTATPTATATPLVTPPIR